MNTKFLDNEVFCIGCGTSLGTGYQVKNRKYCSNRCQIDYQKKLLVEEWLKTGVCQNANRPMLAIREFLLLDQKGRCSICRNLFMWENKILVPIVDHIDGNASNSKRQNLRLVCPNCDSQLPTFKNKNKGNGRVSRMKRYREGKSY